MSTLAACEQRDEASARLSEELMLDQLVFGKPRPALIIQGDAFAGTATVTVLLVSGTPAEAPRLRVFVEPTSENGFRKASQMMIDKGIRI